MIAAAFGYDDLQDDGFIIQWIIDRLAWRVQRRWRLRPGKPA
jgi:hypothetical protein